MENEVKFTPGPWAVESMFGYPTALGVGVEGTETAFAVLTRDSNGNAETQYANACLIAAAPALYESLQNLYGDLYLLGLREIELSEIYEGSFPDARAALALVNVQPASTDAEILGERR